MPTSMISRSRTLAATFFAAASFALTTGDANAAPARKAAAPANAYMALVSATEHEIDRKKVDYAVSRTHDTVKDPDDREYTPAEMATLATENQKVIAEVRSALKLPYTPPPIVDVDAKLPYLARFRALARLLLLDAKVKEAQGQWAAGLDSRLDAFAMGEKIQSNTAILGCLVGVACEAIGTRSEWDNVEHLNAAESKAAARRLEALIAGHPPFAGALVNERLVGRKMMVSLFKVHDAFAYFKAGDTNLTDEDEPLVKDAAAEMHRAGLSAALRDYDAAWPIAIKRMSGVWSAPSDPVRPPGQLVMTRVLLSVITPKVRFKILLAETQARLLLTNLAIRAYHLDNGKYPDSLNDLCPKYLKAPPADLFSDNQPLRYGHMGEAPLIYSIGPDGVDDSGQPTLSADAKDDSKRYQVLYESEGDIVGGTNT